MIESIIKRWKNFAMKGWLLYYSERRKNAEIRRAIQQTSHTLQEPLLNKWAMQPRDTKEHNSQSIAHSVPESDDSRAINNNSRAKWKSSKRGRKGVATRDTN